MALFYVSAAAQDDSLDWLDLDEPDLVDKLPSSLVETSGLTSINDTTLVAIQDEKGYLYFLDSRTGKLRKRTRFGPSGDYEGVAYTGTHIYVLRSDGDLYRVEGYDGEDPTATKLENELSQRFDTEGLVFDPYYNRLLIACKEYPGRRLSGHRSIYAFDLDSNQLETVPAFALNYNGRKIDEYPDRLSRFEKDHRKLRDFKPSAIAIDPMSRDLYIVSSVWKVLVVVAPNGLIRDVKELPDDLRQPEGIAFDLSGNLYISSEGRGKRALLMRFDRNTDGSPTRE